MRRLKKEREVVDAIWADSFRSGTSAQRAEAIRRGELSALLQFGIRIAP
jgi:predicted metalloprotease